MKNFPVNAWLEFLGDRSAGIPDAWSIYKHGRECYETGDLQGAKKAENLNFILHNSAIPSEAAMPERVHFAYGGIGVILHKDSELKLGVSIGSGVVLGGGVRGRGRTHSDGRRVGAPLIGEHAVLSTGAKILGGVEIGSFSIIGANAGVRDSCPPLSILAGVPAKLIGRIDQSNCERYKSMFLDMRTHSAEEFAELIVSIGGA